MKASKSILKLNAKPHNRFGIVAFILVFVAAMFSVGSIYIIAVEMRTEQNVIVAGALELLGAIMTIAGIVLGVIGEEADDTEKLFVHIALVLHVLGLIYHGVIVYQGFLMH